jgi:hypothetical protein
LLGLFFYREDGGDMFLRIISWLLTDYRSLYLTRQNSYISNMLKQGSNNGYFTRIYTRMCVSWHISSVIRAKLSIDTSRSKKYSEKS